MQEKLTQVIGNDVRDVQTYNNIDRDNGGRVDSACMRRNGSNKSL